MKEQRIKELKLNIEELEERIAPIVHAFTPIGDVGNPAVGASGGDAGGVAAGGTLTANSEITGFPVPENTPGEGP
ncbi:hypothetical protein MYX78_08950 [Acidobacteria bacterium AH-259-G07]|nr:hypothetical protein [Acidobacteria bacterium AH-259-G07]